jgi:alkyl sulfatase BDS1-like metallo-beta-lactamase superfamily hydrolase
VYALTAYGSELEEIVLRLGRWGAQSLGDPGPEDIVTPDGEVLALRATFRPERATGKRFGFELHVGEVVVHATVDDGVLTANEGPLDGADLIVKLREMTALKPLLTGEVSTGEAIATGLASLTGEPALFEDVVEMFGVDQPVLEVSP